MIIITISQDSMGDNATAADFASWSDFLTTYAAAEFGDVTVRHGDAGAIEASDRDAVQACIDDAWEAWLATR